METNYILVNVNTPTDDNDTNAPNVYKLIRDGHIISLQKAMVVNTNVNAIIYQQKTMLHFACLFGHLNIVKYLIHDLKVSIASVSSMSINDGISPLHIACQYNHYDIVNFLVQHHPQRVNIGMKQKNGWTVLHTATNYGHVKIIQCLVEHGKDILLETQQHDGWTPLHIATRNGFDPIVQYFIHVANANINCQSYNGCTPLHFACSQGSLTIVQTLLSCKNINVNIKQENGWTPIFYAVQHGYIDIVEAIVKSVENTTSAITRKSLINVAANDGTTLLHVAATYGQLYVVQYLLSDFNNNISPISLDALTDKGMTACHLASIHHHYDIVEHIVSKESSVVTTTTIVNGAVQQGDNKQKRTHAFHYACANGLLDVVKVFIRANKNVIHIQDLKEKTGIHLAIINNHLELVKFLIKDGGYDVDIYRSFDRISILHFACIHGKMSIVAFLITECGVDVEEENNRRWRALHFATRNGHLNVVQFLLEVGNANADVVAQGAASVLHVASRFGHLQIVQYLIEQQRCNDSTQRKDPNGYTALHLAVMNGYVETARYLVVHGKANVEQTLGKDMTAIQLAKRCKNFAMVRLFLELGADDKKLTEAMGPSWGYVPAFTHGFTEVDDIQNLWKARNKDFDKDVPGFVAVWPSMNYNVGHDQNTFEYAAEHYS